MPLENVLYIETGTKIASFSDMLEVIEQYNECAWYDLDRQRCLETVEYFLFRGLIHQCSLINGEIKTIPAEGVWVEATPRQILLTDECEIHHPTVTYENIEQVIDFHQSEGFDDGDGMPDFTNEQHLIKLYEVLKDFGWPADARIELIKTITEAGDTYSGINGNPPKGKKSHAGTQEIPFF